MELVKDVLNKFNVDKRDVPKEFMDWTVVAYSYERSVSHGLNLILHVNRMFGLCEINSEIKIGIFEEE